MIAQSAWDKGWCSCGSLPAVSKLLLSPDKTPFFRSLVKGGFVFLGYCNVSSANRVRVLALSLLSAMAVGCDDRIVSPEADVARSFTLVSGRVVNVKDVPALTIDLPDSPPPWQESDSALIAAMVASEKMAFIGLKSPGKAHASQTVRMELKEAWRPGIFGKKGDRAAIDAASVRAGLALIEAHGGTVVSYHDAIGLAFVRLEPRDAPILRQSPLVDYLEPALTRFEPTSARPTQMDFSSSSAFLFAQTTPYGITMVRAQQAWTLSTGYGARLLIIDTGHQQNHEDLLGVSSGNCFGAEGGCDDVGDNPHGTQVSGVAIARDNSVGVVGVAPGMNSADVFYAGACDDYLGPGCDLDEVAGALNWAVTYLGSKGVINMSIATATGSTALSNAIAAAWSAGHVLVAAVGNATSNADRYPAKYSNVVGVSGVNQDSTFAAQNNVGSACPSNTWSNYGDFVDMTGPFDAYTTTTSNSYATKCGTSFATPHVVGAALIARAANPGWTNTKVVYQLTSTAHRVNGNLDDYTGYGIPRADLAAGLYATSMTASLVTGKPRLTWTSIPMAASYRIYRRIFRNGVGGEYEWWGTSTGTTWTDTMSSSSFYGYQTWPASGTAVNYHVRPTSADGVESSWIGDATFIPIGEPPE